MNLARIPLSHLVASAQPRPLLTAEVDKLASSIKEVGLIQPITVTKAVVMHGLPEQGWKIVAGHHRVAACRALGWTEIDALVIEDMAHLQTELIEIDENLCRAELSASQRRAFTKRREQIWEALHPPKVNQRFESVFDALGIEPPDEDAVPAPKKTSVAMESAINLKQVGQVVPPVAKHGHAQDKGFAAATAAATGQTKRTTNRALASANALGIDTLNKLTHTSLDSGVELDALAKLPAPERVVLVERAAAGEHVSARPAKPAQAEPSATKTPIKDSASSDIKWLYGNIKVALRSVLDVYGCLSIAELQQLVNRRIKTANEDEVESICDTIDYLEQWTRALSGIDVVSLATRK